MQFARICQRPRNRDRQHGHETPTVIATQNPMPGVDPLRSVTSGSFVETYKRKQNERRLPIAYVPKPVVVARSAVAHDLKTSVGF